LLSKNPDLANDPEVKAAARKTMIAVAEKATGILDIAAEFTNQTKLKEVLGQEGLQDEEVKGAIRGWARGKLKRGLADDIGHVKAVVEDGFLRTEDLTNDREIMEVIKGKEIVTRGNLIRILELGNYLSDEDRTELEKAEEEQQAEKEQKIKEVEAVVDLLLSEGGEWFNVKKNAGEIDMERIKSSPEFKQVTKQKLVGEIWGDNAKNLYNYQAMRLLTFNPDLANDPEVKAAAKHTLIKAMGKNKYGSFELSRQMALKEVVGEDGLRDEEVKRGARELVKRELREGKGGDFSYVAHLMEGKFLEVGDLKDHSMMEAMKMGMLKRYLTGEGMSNVLGRILNVDQEELKKLGAELEKWRKEEEKNKGREAETGRVEVDEQEIRLAIKNSPSHVLRNFERAFVSEIMEVENPRERLKQIENIFVNKRLPDVEANFEVFKILQGGVSGLDWKIEQNRRTVSPYLKEVNSLQRMETIYGDLLKIHLDSNNETLGKFLGKIVEGQERLVSLSEGIERDDNQGEVIEKLNQLTAFYNNELNGGGQKAPFEELTVAATKNEIREQYNFLEREIKALEANWRKRLNYTGRFDGEEGTIGEALSYMEIHIQQTDNQHRQLLVRDEGGGYARLRVKDSDYSKDVDRSFFRDILRNGSVAKEYLGMSERPPSDVGSGDYTPLDTDLSGGIKILGDYGDVSFVLQNREGRFNKTRIDDPSYYGSRETIYKYDGSKLELFTTSDNESETNGTLGGVPYGIRTGFAASEIDWIVLTGEKWDDQERQNIFSEIVKNGFYIPVTDVRGTVIFAPEDFDRLRAAGKQVKEEVIRAT
jgi:hypothetical protein